MIAQYYRSLRRHYFGDAVDELLSGAVTMPGGAKNYCFTLNNYEALLDPSSWPFAVYCIYQEEVGESGTPHLQGYVMFSQKRTLATVKTLEGLERAHFEVARGTPEQNDLYASKEVGRLGGPYVWGVKGTGQGARKDLGVIADKIRSGTSLKRIAEDHPSDFIRYHHGFAVLQTHVAPKRSNDLTTLCFVFYGAGGTGKSSFARRLASRLSSDEGASGDVFNLSPAKGSGTYWDGYNQGDVVIIDEFKGNRMTPGNFNQLIDAGPVTVPIHGGQVQFNSRYVIITTNVHPKEWWPSLKFGHSLRRRLIIWPLFRSLSYTRSAVLPPIIFDQRLGVFRHSN